jgi:hypothetical protein
VLEDTTLTPAATIAKRFIPYVLAAYTLLAKSTIAVSMSDPIWLVSLLATRKRGLYLGRYGMTSSPQPEAVFEVMNCR